MKASTSVLASVLASVHTPHWRTPRVESDMFTSVRSSKLGYKSRTPTSFRRI